MVTKKEIHEEQRKIGRFIAELRELKGFTQASFAKALKTSQSAVARMEKGEQNFSTEMLAKVSEVLNREIITLAGRSINFRVEGGRKLRGKITTNTSKNAAVALLCASLLNEGATVLKNVPKIEEVHRVVEVLLSIGVTVRWRGSDVEIRPPRKPNLQTIDVEAAVKTRSVLLLLGPLSHLLRRFSLPLSGGCKLGARTVRPHLYALERFGVGIETVHDRYEVSVKKPKAAEVVLYEMGDTVTENALTMAARLPGTSTIRFASSNYMVQDLCRFLQVLGVGVEGIGTSTLTVTGAARINRDVEFSLSEDPIEAMMFLSLAAATNSSVTVERCPVDFLELELLKLEKMGLRFKVLRRYKSQNGFTNLADIQTFPSKLKALEDKIHPLPYPGINIDNLNFFVPVAAVAEGTTLIHDWVYEDRAIYYLELNKLRADIKLLDPHRVLVKGPTVFKPAEVICPPALRPAAIILIAMLAAKGTSVLRNVYSISRGYEDLAERLKQIGAKIEVLHSF